MWIPIAPANEFTSIPKIVYFESTISPLESFCYMENFRCCPAYPRYLLTINLSPDTTQTTRLWNLGLSVTPLPENCSIANIVVWCLSVRNLTCTSRVSKSTGNVWGIPIDESVIGAEVLIIMPEIWGNYSRQNMPAGLYDFSCRMHVNFCESALDGLWSSCTTSIHKGADPWRILPKGGRLYTTKISGWTGRTKRQKHGM